MTIYTKKDAGNKSLHAPTRAVCVRSFHFLTLKGWWHWLLYFISFFYFFFFAFLALIPLERSLPKRQHRILYCTVLDTFCFEDLCSSMVFCATVSRRVQFCFSSFFLSPVSGYTIQGQIFFLGGQKTALLFLFIFSRGHDVYENRIAFI